MARGQTAPQRRIGSSNESASDNAQQHDSSRSHHRCKKPRPTSRRRSSEEMERLNGKIDRMLVELSRLSPHGRGRRRRCRSTSTGAPNTKCLSNGTTRSKRRWICSLSGSTVLRSGRNNWSARAQVWRSCGRAIRESAQKFAAQHSFTLDTRAPARGPNDMPRQHARRMHSTKRQELTEQMNARPAKMLNSFVNAGATETQLDAIRSRSRQWSGTNDARAPAADVAAKQAASQEAVGEL